MNSFNVINVDGEKEAFSFKKVYQSAIRTGASPSLAKEIAETIKKETYPGIKTSEILRRIKRLLQKENPKAALRFNLKEAMRKLGPTGFPFEKYIGEILLKNGFQVRLSQHLSGKCVSRYEIDFLAKKGNLTWIGECKYRNRAGEKVDLGTALSNYARFLDIKNFLKDQKIQSWLITNAKFTSNAIRYSQCVGVELLGWKYPLSKGLESLIEKQGLYPITILPSLKPFLANIFVSKRMMLVRDLLKTNPKQLSRKLKISSSKLKPLIEEAEILLK